MNWKLFLDDLRHPNTSDYIVARTVMEAKILIRHKGFPTQISFDHDLGIDEKDRLLESGYDFAKWMVEADQCGDISIPLNFTFTVHSANPVGAKNIRSLLENYLKFKQHDTDLLGYTTAMLRQCHTGSRVMWVNTCLDAEEPTIRIRTDTEDTGTGMLKYSVLMSIAQEPTYLQRTDSDGKSLDTVSEAKAIDFIRNNLDLLLAFWDQKEIDEDDLKIELDQLNQTKGETTCTAILDLKKRK